MFGMLENLTKAALNIVVLPVDIVADVVTLGGSLIGKDESYTVKRTEDFIKNLNKAFDPNE